MAKVWFTVLVLIFVENVFANDCPVSSQQILNCDQCMRCGSNWCSQPNRMNEHCMAHVTDNWCNQPERPTQIPALQSPGQTIELVYAERSLFIDKTDKLRFNYNSPVPRKISHEIYNTTQNFANINVKIEPAKCTDSKCEAKIAAKVSPGFCTNQSTDMEFIYVALKVENTTEEAVIKYHVPCACACSKYVETQAAQCHGNGDFSCGVCSCYEGWSGPQCNKVNCEEGRGDIAHCYNILHDKVACSGNGYCGPCDTCICYNNMTGSQYFDRTNFCSDICMDTRNCQHCLTNGVPGPCDPTIHDVEAECAHSLMVLKFDQGIVAERDRLDWVTCNNTFKDPDCSVEYLAQRTEGGISVMVVKSCQDHVWGGQAGGGAVGTKVPIILGVLGILAAVAAVGGVMLWKHLHAVPPMPFSSPDYQNIDAEDCVGENPLYKSPTSTFTNPQFGKC